MKKKSEQKRRTAQEYGPDPIDAHVGHRLRQARRLAGLSQTELGEGIGVSFQAVQKYEEGTNRLSASRLFHAAKLLKRSVYFFFEGIESKSASESGENFSVREIDLVRSFRRIEDEGLRDSLRKLMAQVDGSHSKADRGRK